jgi:hypothetical protein
MSLGEICIVLHALSPAIASAIGAAITIAAILKFYVPGYLQEKGKNLATKEDISDITEIIESVKRQHAEILEDLKTKNQLRLSALDSRLRAHQEAYGLWREINGSIDTEKLSDVIKKCDEWWGSNCLYLEPAARSAFLGAFVGARDLGFYMSCTDSADLVHKIRIEIQGAGGIIEDCVALPRLNEIERLKPR